MDVRHSMENNDNENIIPVIFTKEFFDNLYTYIKYNGHVKAESWLLSQGFHATFVKCAIKKILSERGW